MVLDEALHPEFIVSRILKIGNNEFHVEVQLLTDGGFTFVVVESDTGGENAGETRYDSKLRFDTEEAAYEGGSAYVRRRVAKIGR
ncbi:hypothetical protein [Caballeronia sp. Lep1P3]|uniref:hypothetical protein n=1 Tax=Caballeronia sp. Lep1P3 TaxID=2878150 RepID=UPI001FD2D722|nr:hypothetical protein [Caballeronia sp. Lep1P3]